LRNAADWIEEFHFDGLRLDATQSIIDDSVRHVIVLATARAREGERVRGTLRLQADDGLLVRLC